MFSIGRSVSPLPFNPLMPPAGCSSEVQRYIGKVADVIGRAFYTGHGVNALLLRAFHALIQRWKENPAEIPTFKAALKWVREYNPSKNGLGRRASDWRESTIRAVEQLCMGEFGKALNTVPGVDIEVLLDRDVIFELDGLTSSQKAFFVEALLLWRREHALAALDTQPKEQLRSVLVIEEAHNILKTGTERNADESVLEVTLRETRSLGMGIILLDQTPALINKVATSNVFTSIYFSLQGRFNVNAAADALLLDLEQREFLGRLPVGNAICKMADHWMEPFMLRVPLMAVKNEVVSDQDVIQHMLPLWRELPGCSSDSTSTRAPLGESEVIPVVTESAKKGITEAEKAFLVDIFKRPFVGMTNRYRSLGVSTRNGNAIRQAVEASGLVAVRDVNTGTAQLKLPELTEKGANYLQSHGYRVEANGCVGGAEHHYWVHRIADHYRRRGYQVTLEKSLPSGGRVDIEAVKGDEKLALEVETGKSDVKGNVEKLINLGYSRVVLVPTNAEAKAVCNAAASAQPNVQMTSTSLF